MAQLSSNSPIYIVGERALSIDDLVAVAGARGSVALSQRPEFVERIEHSRRLLAAALSRGNPIYGVTTGFGSECGTSVSPEQSIELGKNLLRYHGCGTGPRLDERHVRGAMLCRLACLGAGFSGVSMALLAQLVEFLNRGITPVVPCQGSVGASGDLTPMSYVASALAGQRLVMLGGKTMPASEALALTGLRPYVFGPKEAISMLNGTPVMTGVAISVVDECRKILGAGACATALAVHALGGHSHHLDAFLFRAKPFDGQADVASRLRNLLHCLTGVSEALDPSALQDPYSLRCAPHVLGVLGDALQWVTRWVETEANGVSDNPLIDPSSGRIVMGGNFYGGHIAFAMDAVKTAVSSVADLCDRQVALLVDPKFSRGLPAGLVDASKGHGPSHGFKGLQITASALTAEALGASMPAAAFSRSTESHNQDKVSMGTIAAREALRVCELTRKVIAIDLLVAAQACELRGSLDCRPAVNSAVSRVRALSRAIDTDRELDNDLELVSTAIFDGIFEPESSHPC